MDIAVPAAEEVDDTTRTVNEIIINVQEDGTVLLNERKYTQDELLARLSTIAAVDQNQAVILRGDSKADFQHIIDVLDTIKKSGIWNVAFAATKPQQEP